MGFFTRLEQRCTQIDSILCVGLDPHPQDLPENTAAAAQAFCLDLIEATAETAAAFKPNIAFFEALGPEGIAALQAVIAAVPEDIPIILDAKRGDIASTAQAYAQAVFQTYQAHAVTLSPYLGKDSLEPFLLDPQRGVFLLCKTSNPGSGDLQDLPLKSGEPVYLHLAKLAQSWNTQDNLGLVVGATHPEALRRVRQAAPHLWVLAPGVGAQGGDINEALHAGLRPDGLGLLVPVSRGISRAADPRLAAEDLRDAFNRARQKNTQTKVASASSPQLTSLAAELAKVGCIQFGDFTLKSGLQSPIYIDLRRLTGHPRLLAQVAQAYRPLLENLHFDRLAALPYAALPIGAAISLQGNWPLIYPRKEVKDYGTKAVVEGEHHPGETAIIIDDLTTTGGSKLEAIDKLTAAGLAVKDVVVLIDRESGAKAALAEHGLALHAVFTLTELVELLHTQGRITAEQRQAVINFIASSKP